MLWGKLGRKVATCSPQFAAPLFWPTPQRARKPAEARDWPMALSHRSGDHEALLLLW